MTLRDWLKVASLADVAGLLYMAWDSWKTFQIIYPFAGSFPNWDTLRNALIETSAGLSKEGAAFHREACEKGLQRALDRFAAVYLKHEGGDSKLLGDRAVVVCLHTGCVVFTGCVEESYGVAEPVILTNKWDECRKR